MSTTEKPTKAAANAEKADTDAAASQTADDGAQDQAKKDKPKRDRRRNRGPKKGEEAKEGQQETRYQPKDKEQQENGAPAPEKKPKQQYRQKGEPKEATAGGEGQTEPAGEAKKGDAENQQPPKKSGRRKRPETAGGQEARYRPKGSQAGEDGASPENGAAGSESPKAGEKDADGKSPKKDDKKKEKKDDEEKEKEKKNLVYQNPMEFKETKKFKSKWEEYRGGDWRRGSGKTYVTLETVIPEMPDKLLTPPDEASFHKKLLEIEDKIKSIGQDLEDKKTEFDGKLQEKIQAQKSGDGQTSVAKDIGQNFQRLAELKKQRKKIYDAQEEVSSQTIELNAKRERLSKKIDKEAQKEEDIPKAVKRTQKALETQTHDAKRERELLARIKFIKASVEFIREREVIDQQLRVHNEERKKIGVDLPRIKKEIKELSEVVDVQKKARDEKQENRESLEKELDKINERRKRARDERDKLYKQKYELKDEYYGALITYSKQQFLIKDINWMNEMQGKLKTRQAEKERREAVYKERQERLKKEREERAKKEEERKQREVDRRQKEVENKKRLEEQLQQDEIDQLNKIIEAIEDSSVGSNPFFEQIDQCEQLTKFCQKQKAKLSGQTAVQEEPGTSKKDQDNNRTEGGELAKALAKGSVQLAPTKESRDAPGMGASKGKGKKGKKNASAATGADAGGQIDFAMVNKFGVLKIAPPIGSDDSYDNTISTLQELKEALIYWGKILQRQKKIKHIRSSRKLKSLDDYNNMADEEEQWLQNEKEKIENAEDDIESGDAKISLAKIKIAQTIDKEMRLKNIWHEEEEEGEDDSEEDRGYTVDDMGDEENPREEPVQKRERKQKGGEGKVKQAQRPNAKKFNEIMKNDSEAFPTFDNQSGDDDDDEGEGDE